MASHLFSVFGWLIIFFSYLLKFDNIVIKLDST